MTTELRVLRPDEWDVWFDAVELAFGGVAESREAREFFRDATEPGRSLGAWDGDACVGSASTFSFGLTVPGGALVPAAGLSFVGVAPTHRRRGTLTSMMRRQLDDVRAGGEPLALLTASEPAIYGRFGYGMATQQLAAEIDTSRVRLAVPDGTDGVRLTEVRAQDAGVRRACEAVYARNVPTRPGMLARRPHWERQPLLDPESERGGASPLRCVLAERGGGGSGEVSEVVGYVRFQVRPGTGWRGTDGAVVLRDLEALDPAAYGALWRFLFDIDLTSRIRLRNRPVDDAWQHLVSDIRRCDVGLKDSLFVRLVNVGVALEARAYLAPVDVVFEVTDAFCPWNEGRWRLTGDDKGGASCGRTAEAADLALSVRELGAAYLGGVSLASLAAAGRVRELRPGALSEASVAFGAGVAPWLPHGF
ncbi:GNAT family N-acetyltransferase [Streptomyces hypolithicus]